MRTVTVGAQAKIDQRLGTAPILVLEIQWVKDGPIKRYSDIESVANHISASMLEVSGLDNVITISGVRQATTGESQQVSFTLDDTDGAIKDILDTNDVHKRDAYIYQWYEDLDYSDKFLLFKGQISSPLEWNEGDRTVSFDVINKIEDTEVGFSAEEGDFPFLPEELIGKPWPLVFGTCIHVPALMVRSPFKGILRTGFGVHDFTLPSRLDQLNKTCCPIVFNGYNFVQNPVTFTIEIFPVYIPEPGCFCQRAGKITELTEELALQKTYEFSNIEIIGGDLFPQGTFITLDICGAKVHGKFTGTEEVPTNTFAVQYYRHPLFGTLTIPKVKRFICSVEDVTNPNPSGFGTVGNDQGPNVPLVCGNDDPDNDRTNLGWDYLGTFPEADFFWAEPGCEVFISGDDEIVYVVNLLPSTLLRVAAYRTFENGVRVLTTIPNDYYTTRISDFNGYSVTEIVFEGLLSRRGEGWEDEVFVSQESSIGPNTVDIIEWLIEKYTDFTIDATSFNDVRTKIDNYPSSFPILSRPNILTLLKDIAFQARCALILRNDVFYIRYLSEEPDVDFELNGEDVLAKSLVLTHTDTEDLVTKIVARWKKDYAVDANNTVILRYNVARYGVQSEEFDFYIYNILELVRKSATFWLIRMANTWRRVICRTPLTKLQGEVFDVVEVDLQVLSPNLIKALVEKATYDSESHEIEFELWTPVRAGEQNTFDFAWPSQISETLLWPTPEDLTNGVAGGSGPNVDVTPPNGHPLSQPTGYSFSSEKDSCSRIFGKYLSGDILGRCRQDHGDTQPSDIDDQKPFVQVPGQGETNIPSTKNPRGDLSPQIKAINQRINEQDANTKASTVQNQDQFDKLQQDSPDGQDPFEGLPEEPADPSCKTWVQYFNYTRVNSVITGSGISTTPGDMGPIASSPVPDGGGEGSQVRLYFDSKEAADQAEDYLVSIQHSPGTVGEPHIVPGSISKNTANWTPGCTEPDTKSVVAVNRPTEDFNWQDGAMDVVQQALL